MWGTQSADESDDARMSVESSATTTFSSNTTHVGHAAGAMSSSSLSSSLSGSALTTIPAAGMGMETGRETTVGGATTTASAGLILLNSSLAYTSIVSRPNAYGTFQSYEELEDARPMSVVLMVRPSCTINERHIRHFLRSDMIRGGHALVHIDSSNHRAQAARAVLEAMAALFCRLRPLDALVASDDDAKTSTTASTKRRPRCRFFRETLHADTSVLNDGGDWHLPVAYRFTLFLTDPEYNEVGRDFLAHFDNSIERLAQVADELTQSDMYQKALTSCKSISIEDVQNALNPLSLLRLSRAVNIQKGLVRSSQCNMNNYMRRSFDNTKTRYGFFDPQMVYEFNEVDCRPGMFENLIFTPPYMDLGLPQALVAHHNPVEFKRLLQQTSSEREVIGWGCGLTPAVSVLLYGTPVGQGRCCGPNPVWIYALSGGVDGKTNYYFCANPPCVAAAEAKQTAWTLRADEKKKTKAAQKEAHAEAKKKLAEAKRAMDEADMALSLKNEDGDEKDDDDFLDSIMDKMNGDRDDHGATSSSASLAMPSKHKMSGEETKALSAIASAAVGATSSSSSNSSKNKSKSAGDIPITVPDVPILHGRPTASAAAALSKPGKATESTGIRSLDTLLAGLTVKDG